MIKNTISAINQKQHVHLFVILACIVMQMFTIGEGYRFFAYLNLLMVIAGIYSFTKTDNALLGGKWLGNIFFYPALFVLIHFISQQDIVMLKEMRHILLAVFLAIGVVMLSKKSIHYMMKNLYWITALIISIYVIGQLIAILIYGKPYGTTKNPHYLAFYSAVFLIVCLFCFFKSSLFFKCFFGVCMVSLGFLLLETGYRPAWLGLLFSAMVVIAFFIDKKLKLQAFFTLLMLIFMLSITNVGGFLDRSKNLIYSVESEERVTIWKETWAMQMDSSAFEWVAGHGMDSFEDDFKPYSSYHLKQIDFNSPHNYFLEILYISGLLGIALFGGMLWAIYKKLINCILTNDKLKAVYIMLFSVFTTCFIFAGITLPFFNSKSMNIIAYVVGVIFFLERANSQKLNNE